MINENLKKTRDVWVRKMLYMVFIIFLYIVFTIWGKEANFPESVYTSLIELLNFILIIFFIIPSDGGVKWIKYFKEESVKSKSIYVVVLPIIFAIFDNLIISITRYIPKILGGDIINIGSGQAVIILKEFTFEYTVFYCVLPAFTEEIIFRFLPYVGLGIIVDNILKVKKKFEHKKIKLEFIFKAVENLKKDLFLNKKTYAVVLWITITSTVFALAHGPNITNFYFYFTGGALFGWLYLKYGLVSAMLGHMLNNYLSPTILSLVTYILSDVIRII